MALQVNLDLDSGISCPEAYARISLIHLTHLELVSVQWWASAQARQDNKATLRNEAYSLPWQEPVSLQAMYNLLKELPDFADAIDV